MPNTTPKPKRQAARTPATSPLDHVDRELSAAAKASFITRFKVRPCPEATVVRAFARQAKRHGVEKVPGIAPWRFPEGSIPPAFSRLRCSPFDHVDCWKTVSGEYVVTSQPYGLGREGIEVLRGLCDATGTDLQIDSRSWHFPMATVLIVLTLPAQRPFPRCQEDGDDIEKGLSCPD